MNDTAARARTVAAQERMKPAGQSPIGSVASRMLDEAADEIDRLQDAKRRALQVADERAKETVALRGLLREAIPFINDAGNDECPEAQQRANDLFVRIAGDLEQNKST